MRKRGVFAAARRAGGSFLMRHAICVRGSFFGAARDLFIVVHDHHFTFRFPVVSARALRAETTFLDLFYIRSAGAFIRIVGDKTVMSALYWKKRDGKTECEAKTGYNRLRPAQPSFIDYMQNTQRRRARGAQNISFFVLTTILCGDIIRFNNYNAMMRSSKRGTPE